MSASGQARRSIQTVREVEVKEDDIGAEFNRGIDATGAAFDRAINNILAIKARIEKDRES